MHDHDLPDEGVKPPQRWALALVMALILAALAAPFL
jgi:hypothetical protein